MVELGYDPAGVGPSGVGVRTVQLPDRGRGWRLPCELWYPTDPGPAVGAVGGTSAVDAGGEVRGAAPVLDQLPLVVFSHLSGGHRRSSTFLCRHLASHGYAVAAVDHSEVVAPELAARSGESDAARQARVAAVVACRVPDVRLVLGQLLDDPAGSGGDLRLDGTRVAIVGHSFGGWTALATPETEPRIRAVVALAPGGATRPRPGILPVRLTFDWGRDVPTLFLTGDQDVMTPLDGIAELYGRTAATKRMFVLRGADHLHFLDDVEDAHESLRQATLPGDAAWIPAAMRPFAELCPAGPAHEATRALTLAHLDATLRADPQAQAFLERSPDGGVVRARPGHPAGLVGDVSGWRGGG